MRDPMARKRNAIILNKITAKSADDLESMVTELTGDQTRMVKEGSRVSRWSQRFIASGKGNRAPKIRLS
jgi:hypothetical protein